MYADFSRYQLYVFAVLLTLTAIFFGGNFPLAMGLVPLICAILFLLGTFTPTYALKASIHRLLPLGVFAPLLVVVIWGGIQAFPLASSLVSPFWSVAPLEGQGGWASISVNPAATLAYLPYSVGLLAMAWALYRVGQSNPMRILKPTAIIITLCCLYGIFIFATGNQSVLWLEKTSYINSLTGTFINRNSFATFAGLGMLANLGIVLHRIGEVSTRLDTRQRLRAFWLLVIRPNTKWLVLALICLLALVLTNSRAGITASLCAFIVMLGSLAGMRPAVRWPLFTAIGTFVVLVIIVLAAVGQDLGNRVARVGDDAAIRQSIFSATTDLIHQQPITGSGYGAYETAFRTARSVQLTQTLPYAIDHAHNTYLELTAELGYPAMALLALSAFSLLVSFLMGLTLRRRAVMWPALGVSVLVLVGGHALADFSLSIPAVAIAAIALLMAAFGQSLPREESPSAANRLTIIPVALLVMALLGVSVWQSMANYYHYKAGPTLRAIEATQPVGPAQIFEAQRYLMKCVNINPLHPSCRDGLAQLNLSLATGYGLTGPKAGVALVYLNMARQSYLDILARTAVHPLAWYRLARIDAYLGNKPAAVTSLANSILTGPGEPPIAIQRVPLMLSLLPVADADNASLFKTQILTLWQTSPWSMSSVLKTSPAVWPAFAELIKDQPDAAARWQRYLKSPLPEALRATQPLGARLQKG